MARRARPRLIPPNSMPGAPKGLPAPRLAALRPTPLADRARRMRVVATALLVGMGIVFLVARQFEHVHPAVGGVAERETKTAAFRTCRC